jgi:hypothetical protein
LTAQNITPDLSPLIRLTYEVVPPDPDLALSEDTYPGDLHIYATNHGHGPANACTIRLNSPPLEKRYGLHRLTWTGSLQSGEKACILRLSSKRTLFDRKSYPLLPLEAEVSQATNRHTSTVESFVGHWQKLELTSRGFVFSSGHVKMRLKPPQTFPCVLFGQAEGTELRQFPVGLTLQPTETSAFQLLVGHQRSATFDLIFTLNDDQGHATASEPCRLSVKNLIGEVDYDTYEENWGLL